MFFAFRFVEKIFLNRYIDRYSFVMIHFAMIHICAILLTAALTVLQLKLKHEL